MISLDLAVIGVMGNGANRVTLIPDAGLWSTGSTGQCRTDWS